MSDLIDRRTLIKDLVADCLKAKEESLNKQMNISDIYCRIESLVYKQKQIEAKPVVYGEWIEVKGVLSWFYKCSECGMFHEYKRKFCNGCGAYIRGGKNE